MGDKEQSDAGERDRASSQQTPTGSSGSYGPHEPPERGDPKRDAHSLNREQPTDHHEGDNDPEPSKLSGKEDRGA